MRGRAGIAFSRRFSRGIAAAETERAGRSEGGTSEGGKEGGGEGGELGKDNDVCRDVEVAASAPRVPCTPQSVNGVQRVPVPVPTLADIGRGIGADRAGGGGGGGIAGGADGAAGLNARGSLLSSSPVHGLGGGGGGGGGGSGIAGGGGGGKSGSSVQAPMAAAGPGIGTSTPPARHMHTRARLQTSAHAQSRLAASPLSRPAAPSSLPSLGSFPHVCVRHYMHLCVALYAICTHPHLYIHHA